MKMHMHTARDLEKILKGCASHRRISILLYLDKYPDSTLEQFLETSKSNYNNICEHTLKLVRAGLISKHNDGFYVRHNLTRLGRQMISLMRKIA